MTRRPEGARPRRWQDWYVVGLVAGAAAFCLGPSLVGARTLISVNSLTNNLPWQAGGNDATGHQLCQSDTIDTIMPGIAYMRHEIFSGHLGSWQSYSAGGGVLASVPNLGMLDPLSLPYWILPLRWAPAFVIALSWIVGIAGTYLFLRRLSVGRPASILAGFVFVTSGFMVVWSNWPQTRTAALIPALFWATERLVTTRRGRDVALLAVVVASMIFGGFPEVTGFALYGASGYFVVRAVMLYRHDLRRMAIAMGSAAVGLGIGTALAAVQLLPFASSYVTDNEAATRAAYDQMGLPPAGLETLFAPATNGLCIVGPSTIFGRVNPVELIAYVGAATAVLAVVGLACLGRRHRHHANGVTAYFALALAVAITVGWVSPPVHRAADHLPIFDGNPIGRIRSVIGFGAAVLAAFGFDWLTTRPPWGHGNDPDPMVPRHSRRRDRRWVAIGWAAAVWIAAGVAGVAIVRLGHRQAFQEGFVHNWDHSIRIPLVLVGGSVLVVALTTLRRRPVQLLAFLVLPVLVVAQGAQFFHGVMPGDSPASFYPGTGDHDFLAAHLGDDRFASSGLPLYSATAFYYRLRSPTGHEFTTASWDALLTRVDPQVMQSPTDSDFRALTAATVGHQPILDQMGVRYVVLPPSELTGASATLVATGHAASGATASCRLPGGPLRGVTVRLAGPLSPAVTSKGFTLDLTVVHGSTTVHSARYFDSTEASGTEDSIAVAAEDLPSGGQTVATVSVRGSSTPLLLAGTGGAPACGAVTPATDGLRLVYASAGAIIYQRLDALPRIRWAGTAEDVTSGGQVAAMAAGMPPSDVLLPPGTPAGSGRGAQVAVTQDSGDHIGATVHAAGNGYLVVADPMQVPGWSVRVDGRPARILDADGAMVAVAVPAGEHRISWVYRAPRQVSGLAVSLVALALVGALTVVDLRRRPDGEVPAPTGHPGGGS